MKIEFSAFTWCELLKTTLVISNLCPFNILCKIAYKQITMHVFDKLFYVNWNSHVNECTFLYEFYFHNIWICIIIRKYFSRGTASLFVSNPTYGKGI